MILLQHFRQPPKMPIIDDVTETVWAVHLVTLECEVEQEQEVLQDRSRVPGQDNIVGGNTGLACVEDFAPHQPLHGYLVGLGEGFQNGFLAGSETFVLLVLLDLNQTVRLPC